MGQSLCNYCKDIFSEEDNKKTQFIREQNKYEPQNGEELKSLSKNIFLKNNDENLNNSNNNNYFQQEKELEEKKRLNPNTNNSENHQSMRGKTIK